MTDILATASDLADLLDSGERVVVLDVRWRLDVPDGRPAYLEGHIPGAVFVDLHHELAAPGEPSDGRHPLPSAAEFQASARRWGINDGDSVVVYDDAAGFGAARAWWMLTDAGVPTRILDGGLAAWRDADLPIETGQVEPAPGGVTLRPGQRVALTIDEAAAFPASGILIDARAAERYRGASESIDPHAGHIPGAINASTMDNLAGRKFLPADALRERFATLGVDGSRPVAVYCGSGVSAAHEIVALNLAGIDAALYPGSWSQWSNTPGRPIATGNQP